MVYELDHIVLATTDLDAAVRRILVSHPWTPTPRRTMDVGEDWIAVPLGGGSYIDIGCAHAPTRRSSTLLARAAADADTFALWVLRSDDCRVEAERLGLECIEHERDGKVVVRTVGIDEGLDSGGVLPCFITYLAPPPAALVVGSGGLTRLVVSDPDRNLRSWAPDCPPNVKVVDHLEPGIVEVAVETWAGTIVLRNRLS